MRPAHAIIDLGAIRHNYRQSKVLAPSAKAIAIIKANAYGHGAVAVAKALSPEADAYGVACLEEAMELRDSGITNPVLLLEGIFEPDELQQVDQHDLYMAVATERQLGWLLEAKLKKPVHVFLKMDSGMHRLGFSPADYPAVYARLAACPHVGQVTLMSHFSRADEPDQPTTERQLERISQVNDHLGLNCSLANSAGTLAWPAAANQAYVRPGIMLYGASPLLAPDDPSHGLLKPAMSLRSEIFSVRELAAGEPIGYGENFICDRPTRVGVVAIGYADGYSRHAQDGTPVSINGKPSRIIGRVSMDMLTVDLTDLPDAKEGDPVELWGNEVDVNLVATHSRTISYTLFTSITRRVPLRYINQ